MPAKSPRRPARAAASKRRRQRESGLDIFHLLAASFGAFSGLALYSWITPGYVPPAHVATAAQSAKDLYVTRIKGSRGADGMFTIAGQVFNSRAMLCKLAKVQLRFFDARNHVVTQTDTLVENIPANAEKPFSARAFVAGAVRYEVGVDVADYY